VELKSLKEYMIFYRDVGIFHEHAVNKILEDFVRACDPRGANITGEFNARGGIKTTVSASYEKNKRK
jgi:7-cyano-7-deazaguanine reductase